MTKEISHIVLYKTEPDLDQLVINILQQHFSRITVVDQLSHICEQLVDKTPKVFLITGETMEQCLAAYYRSLDAVHDSKICEHRMVTLLPRQCQKEAYKAYRSGMIDDYLVSRPLYEFHRILVICEHLLIQLGITLSSSEGVMSFVEQSAHYAEDTQSSIARQFLRKDVMREAFEKTLLDIDTALDKAAERIQQHQSVNLNIAKLKQTLAAIRSDAIRPELLQLQQKAMDLLEQAVDQGNHVDDESEVDSGVPQVSGDVEPAQESSKTQNSPQETAVLNRLYQQPVNPDALLKKQNNIPSVLVVEDDSISIQLTQKLLESYNINVDMVTTGRQAFAALTSQQYDLVLMDITLPDTNGIYIVDQVTSGNGPNSQTPIIILSSNQNKNTVTQAIQRGTKGYIIKPLYKKTLSTLFERYDIPLLPKSHKLS
ncbi:MAG: CheY-like chemotaxis protein [Paraglaciecola sp.]|jgi:CheY-like chemotaxis protein